MNPKDIRDAKVSETVRRLNPHLFGVESVRSEVHEQKAEPTLVGQSPRCKTRPRSVGGNPLVIRVSLICFVKRVLDDDNLSGGCKHLRDAIARSIGVDDRFIKWEYHQCLTQGQPGTAIKIDITPALSSA